MASLAKHLRAVNVTIIRTHPPDHRYACHWTVGPHPEALQGAPDLAGDHDFWPRRRTMNTIGNAGMWIGGSILVATMFVQLGLRAGWLKGPDWLIAIRWGLTISVILLGIGMLLAGVAPIAGGL